MRPCTLRSLATAVAVCVATAAAAVVGGRDEPGGLARSAVMVLGSGGNVCSGIVAAPDVVLTAAHCVTNAAQHRVHYKGANGEPVLIEPASVAVHPGFDKGAIQGRRRSVDLALVRLPAPLPAPFSAIALSATPTPPPAGTALTLGGYGVAAEGEPRTTGTFRTATLAVVEPYGQGTILVWAADAAGLGRFAGAGACQGDSGGALTAAGAVVAVSTWSTGPARKNCGLLTQGVLVAPQRAWLDRVLAGWGRAAQWAP
jgi:Trypsin